MRCRFWSSNGQSNADVVESRLLHPSKVNSIRRHVKVEKNHRGGNETRDRSSHQRRSLLSEIHRSCPLLE